MADHRKRFEQWRRKLPSQTNFLVDQVLETIVPRFEERGFVWYHDYAGGDPAEVAPYTIPLQKREGTAWPSAEIQFGRAKPCFTIYFAALPEVCKRLGVEAIPRERAIVVYAPAYFMLCKGESRNLDGQFGYRWFALSPRSRLRSDVAKAVSLLPVLFDRFDQGIPLDWITHELGYVDDHVMLAGSWGVFERLREARSDRRGSGAA